MPTNGRKKISSSQPHADDGRRRSGTRPSATTLTRKSTTTRTVPVHTGQPGGSVAQPSSVRSRRALVAHPDRPLRERDLDALGVEHRLDPPAQLARHPPLLQRHGLHHEPDHHRVGRQRLDTPDLGLLHHQRRPLRVGVQVVADLGEQALDPGDVLAVRDGDVEHRAGPALGLVADALDLPVRHVPDRAVDRAQARDPQADRLDRPDRLAEVDDVADAVLVLDDHEQAGEEVLDQRLRAETQCDTEDPGAREQRPDVQARARRGSSARPPWRSRRWRRCAAPCPSSARAARAARTRAGCAAPGRSGSSTAGARGPRARAGRPRSGRPPGRSPCARASGRRSRSPGSAGSAAACRRAARPTRRAGARR